MIGEVWKTIKATLSLLEAGMAEKIFAIALLLSIGDLAGMATLIPFVTLLVSPNAMSYFPEWLVSNFSGSRLAFDCTLLFVFFLLYAGKFLIQYCLVAWQARLLAQVNAQVTDEFVGKFLGTRYSVFQTHPASELAGICYSNPVHVTIVISALSSLASEIFFIGLAFLLLGIAYPALAIGLLLVVTVLVYVIFHIAVRPANSLGTQQRLLEGRRHGLFFSIAGSIREISAMELKDVFNARSVAISSQLRAVMASYSALSFAPRIMIEFFFTVSVLAVVAALVISKAKLDQLLPVMSIFLVASIRMTPAVSRVLSAYANVRFSGSFVTHLVEVRDILTVSRRPAEADSLVFDVALRAENISFKYGDQYILKDLNFEIAKGECIGIVGRSGEGKSTLLDLLVGLQPAASGQFYCDGRKFDPFVSGSYRHMVGYVPQSVSLYAESLAFNIALEERPDLQRLEHAIQLAGLVDYVAGLPEGLETNVGENGIRVSGGQRQRIGIARALYRSPQILVFDEATSALDSVTEANLTREIENLRQQMTIILVAHRISTVTKCDQILLLDGGSIVERGSHARLLAAGGRYRDLVLAGEANQVPQESLSAG